MSLSEGSFCALWQLAELHGAMLLGTVMNPTIAALASFEWSTVLARVRQQVPCWCASTGSAAAPGWMRLP
jgi:hypothetical protein